MEFESVVDELYALDRDEFTKVRDQRAAEARKAGEKELAAKIRKLRKPTSAAWLVNRLVREWPTQVAKLTDLGDALRSAHQELAGDRLRTLSRQRHELVQQLTDQAESLAGGSVGESVVREVYDTLDAALTDPDAGRAVAQGRLTTALRPGDPFAGDWLALGPAPARAEPGRKAGATEGTTASADERVPAEAPEAEERESQDGTTKARKKTGTARAKPVKATGDASPAKQEATKQRVAEEDEAAKRTAREEAAERKAREDSARRRREDRKRLRAVLAQARTERNEAVRELRTAERAEAEARRRTASARKTFEAADRRVAEAELDQLDGSHDRH